MPSAAVPTAPTPSTPRARPTTALAADTLARLRAGALRGATRLDLRGCGLHEMPPEVLALADTLEVLDLSANALSQLPAGLARLQRLRILFCSNNRFETLPEVLGQCLSLDTVGFKANQIAELPAAALPWATLRWLILTDNRISALPDALSRCHRLQKLMLAGNRLRALPQGMGQLQRLELLRLAANAFDTAEAALPKALLALPRLAWLAYGGNPFVLPQEQAAERLAVAQGRLPSIAWAALRLHGLLGEGASGQIHAASWQPGEGPAQPVALKLFKGELTSDGLPRSEMAACIAAGRHPHLVGVLGLLAGHPDGLQGLLLPRLPPAQQPLAGPPSMASCSRDVYAAGQRFSGAMVATLAGALHAALSHLHQQGLLHGDLYAHNTLVDPQGRCQLSDFGAASFLPVGDRRRRQALQALDQRALAVLVNELAERCDAPEQGASA